MFDLKNIIKALNYDQKTERVFAIKFSFCASDELLLIITQKKKKLSPHAQSAMGPIGRLLAYR